MHSLKKPRYIRREKGAIELKTIVLLVLALIVIAAVMMGTGSVADFFKKVFGILSGKHENAAVCEHYKVIGGKQDLLDLIYYVKKGYCAGNTKDDVFTFRIDVPGAAAGYNGVEFPTASRNYPPDYFCGGHYYYLTNHPEVPAEIPRKNGDPYVYMQFGDIEMETGADCNYKGNLKVPFAGELENQACIESDKSDLVIMGPEEWRQSSCTSLPGTAFWCTAGEFGWLANTVDRFILKQIDPGQGSKGYKFKTWAIRRSASNRDVVICLIAEKT